MAFHLRPMAAMEGDVIPPRVAFNSSEFMIE